jgi:hypothetical protein
LQLALGEPSGRMAGAHLVAALKFLVCMLASWQAVLVEEES